MSYIEDDAQLGDMNHVFKVTDLKVLYRECLQEFGGDSSTHIHSTRLVEKLHLKKMLVMSYLMHVTLTQRMKLSC